MRASIFVLIVFCLSAVSIDSEACRPLGPAEQRAAEREDRALQEAMVVDLTAEADFVVEVEALAVEEMSGRFRTVRALKGNPASEFIARWVPQYSVGCWPSVGFFNIDVEPGQTYLLYLRGNEIARASLKERGRWGISYRHEFKLAKRSVAPN